jgi:hypothetical protein
MITPQRTSGRGGSSSSSLEKGQTRGGAISQGTESTHMQRQQILLSNSSGKAVPPQHSLGPFMHSIGQGLDDPAQLSTSSVADDDEEDTFALFRRAQQQQQKQQQQAVGSNDATGLVSSSPVLSTQHAMTVLNSWVGSTSFSPAVVHSNHQQHMHALHQMHADASAAAASSHANSAIQLRQSTNHYHAGIKERLGEMI